MFKNKKKYIQQKYNDLKFYISSKFITLSKQPLKEVIVYSLVLYFILEILSSRSIIDGFYSVIDNPLMFIFNTLIIFLTLSVANFFKRKHSMLLLIAVSWVLLGIVNFGLLSHRTTPLTAADIGVLKSVFGILKVYLNYFEMVLIVLLMVSVLIAVIYGFRKLPKIRVQLKNAFFILCCVIVLMRATNTLAFRTNSLSDNFTNIAQAFQDYGFAYCFSISLVDRGINEPETYSTEHVQVVISEIENVVPSKNAETPIKEENLNPPYKTTPDETEDVRDHLGYVTNGNLTGSPNIVMVQLESFFDVNYLKDFQFSEDPTPVFNQLKKDYSSGFLTVPSIGAGTANTEFEILSGMSLKFFGAGEYPYKTVLKEKTVESICYNLDELGYTNHAIHNNTGTFYSRNSVYPNLGFDSYSSIEYMSNVEYNPLGWSKDNILQQEIMKALKASEQQDFIFAVSVQPHGKYPEVVIDESQTITMTAELDESDIVGYEYFINQLYEADEFIGDLIADLSTYEEPVVLVLYGDHLPTMGIENEDLLNNDKFQTEYVMWSNFEMDTVDKDLSAYQLNAYILERLGYDNGILTKLHQKHAHTEDYQEKLLLLQYDMLYGESTVFNGENPHQSKDMTMGVHEVTITDIEQRGEAIFIKGQNFTVWSALFMDDEIKDTFYVDETTLILVDETLDDYQDIFVAQVNAKDKILSQSKTWTLEDIIE